MKSSLKEKLILIAAVALVLLLVLHIDELYSALNLLFASMQALFVGGILAFVLNVPMKKLEDLIAKVPFLKSAKRSLAIVGVLIGFVLIVVGVVMIVLPTLSSTISQFVSVANQAIPKTVTFLQNSGLVSNKLGQQITDYIANFTGWGSVSTYVTGFLSGLVSNVGGIFSNVFMIVIAFFFTLSILGSKEHLQSMATKVLYAFFPEKVVERLSYIGGVIIETYDKFLMSQIIEACIIGGLVFVAYSLSGIPYSAMAGILTGVLSFVPYVGPISACVISALFVAVQNPLLALWSVVLFQILQLIEGNVIYPRVVGQSVGLPTLFTLAAAMIGGNLFGLLGMVFFTPIFAVLYRLVREWTYLRLEKKDIHLEKEVS